MLANYFKLAWRNIRHNGFHSAINVFGLSIGILFALLIGAYIWSELRVNKTFRHADAQYFLTSVWKDPNLGVDITTLGPLAKQLKEDYPSLVADYYRWDGITSVVSKGGKNFRENIQLGDSTLLSMYGFRLLHGDAKTALTQPYSTVITTEIARKYFGKTDVVGETLSIQSFSGTVHDFSITGVLYELPQNSVTKLNAASDNSLFIPTNTFSFFGRMDFELWTNIYIPSYIELKEGVTANDLQQPIQQLINQNAPEDIKRNLKVVPVALTEYHLQANNGLVKRMLYTLAFVGLFILVMAVINFINISISGSAKRTKEIGVRKVLGGLRKHIILQFLAESVIIVFIAAVVAVAAYPLATPLFQKVVGKNIPALASFPLYGNVIMALFVVLTGIAAGLYPAVVLSALKSTDALKGKLQTVKEKVWLRKSMVGFQFCIAAIVMTAALIISKQVSYFFSKSLGYDKEFVVSSQVPRDWSKAGVQKMVAVRNAFASLPHISAATVSYEIPNGNNGGQAPLYKWGQDSAQAVPTQVMITDENYLATYGIKLQAGSFFIGNARDSGKIVLNEQAVRALGFKSAGEAIGQQLRIPDDPTVFTIKGVTADFHFESMQLRVAPLLFFNVQFAPSYRYLSFKIRSGNIPKTIESIQQKWSELLPGSSFEYSFMDDTLKKVYASELQIKNAADTATLLALVIVLLGVLGLLSISIQKRTKEIGVRKVLGASVSNITVLFLKEFLPVLFVGALVSVPLALLVMRGWLNSYAYRIPLTAQPFLFALLILVGVTVLVISIQTGKAAGENPVKSLRTE